MYCCPYCDKSFEARKILSEHAKIFHTNEKMDQAKCKFYNCGSYFSNFKSFYDHLIKKHPCLTINNTESEDSSLPYEEIHTDAVDGRKNLLTPL